LTEKSATGKLDFVITVLTSISLIAILVQIDKCEFILLFVYPLNLEDHRPGAV